MGRFSFMIVLFTAGVAIAQPEQPPPPKPPSRGEELAKPKVVIPEDVGAEMARKTNDGGQGTFEQAMASATRTFIIAAKENQFELGIGGVIDVAKYRALGYSPQPF